MSSNKRLAVIGDPITHSLSPRIHAAAIAAAGIDASYERIQVRSAELPDFVERVRTGLLLGFNVTIPHKQRIAFLVDALEGGAVDTRAVNTVAHKDGRLIGYNTDIAGFRAALGSAGSAQPESALILGSGGAALGVACALVGDRVTVAVSGRSQSAAEDIASRISGVRVVPWAEREIHARRSDLIVNATPLGMSHLRHETPLSLWPRAPGSALAFDLVYGHDTPFLSHARHAGWQALGGLEMLVQQAAESFRLWFGLDPDVQAMRLACEEGEIACSAS